MKFCVKCGTPREGRFCTKCGFAFNDTEPQTQSIELPRPELQYGLGFAPQSHCPNCGEPKGGQLITCSLCGQNF